MAKLKETSDRGPALVAFKESLLLAWKGNGNPRINVMSTVDTHSWRHHVILDPETTEVAPALGTFGDHAYIAWVGANGDSLNVMSSTNGEDWTNKITLPIASAFPPAICTFKQHLYIAWSTLGSGTIRVLSSLDGVAWNIPDRVEVSDARTGAGVSLCVIRDDEGAPDSEMMYLGTVSPFDSTSAGGIVVFRSPDGRDFSERWMLTQRSIGDQDALSRSEPALAFWSEPKDAAEDAEFFPAMRVVWIAPEGTEAPMMTTVISQPNRRFPPSYRRGVGVFDDTTSYPPAMASLAGIPFIAWTGTDSQNHLNVASVTDLPGRRRISVG